MGAPKTHHTGSSFSLMKLKTIIFVSIGITWWLANLLPHYQPILQAQLKSRLAEALLRIPSVKVDWHQDAKPHVAYNQSKVALMIEPRPIPHLVSQMLHMISVVPPDWRFVFIGSEKSILSLSRSFAMKHQRIIGKVDFMILPEPWSIDTKESVFRLLTDMRFYDEFLPGVEWILKFESDSILCANSKSSLNDWLDWSWAGAPRSSEERFAGNGGLSLRRVSAIRRVLAFQERFNDTDPEDEWFGKRIWTLPGEKVASGLHGALSVENIYVENAMGFHVRDGGSKLPEQVWKDYEQRKKIFAYCPELALIMDMKLERERCLDDTKEGELDPDLLVDQEELDDETKRKQAEMKAAAIEEQEAAEQDAIRVKAEEIYSPGVDAGAEADGAEADGAVIEVNGQADTGSDRTAGQSPNFDTYKNPQWKDWEEVDTMKFATDAMSVPVATAADGLGLDLSDSASTFSSAASESHGEETPEYDSNTLDRWHELTAPADAREDSNSADRPSETA